MSLLRQPLLLLARSDRVKKLVSTMPVSSGIVHGYVPGEGTAAAVEATSGLVEDHLSRRPQRRDDRYPRHGGPHDHGRDARHPARAPKGLPRDRRGPPGLPA